MSRTVTLPSGITVPRVGVWLHQSCPKASEHSPLPRDFYEVTGRSKTHVQAIHPTCGLWALWLPRPRSAAPVADEREDRT